MKHPHPCYLYTHVLMVCTVNNQYITCFEQTAPIARLRRFRTKCFYDLCRGDRPRFHVFRCTGSTILDATKVNNEIDRILNKTWRNIYDFLQLPSYWLNYFWKKCGGKKRLNWLDIPGGKEVCSSRVVSILRNVTGKQKPCKGLHTAEIAPSHFGMDRSMDRITF